MSTFGFSARRLVAGALFLSLLPLAGCRNSADTPAPVATSPAASAASASPVPQVELTPGRIETGIGFDGIKLGESKEQVFKVLGQPQETDANEYVPGQTYALYYDKGIELSFAEDKLAVITLQSPNADPKYKTFMGATTAGLGVGTSAEEIIKALGEPAPDSPRALRYPNLGVWFRLDADRGDTSTTPRAQSVQIMKPE